MTRQGVNTLPMLISINRESGEASLHQQLYLSLRKAILEGRLAAGRRLPGSRVLAGDLGVSRATVLTAYDRLKAEGFVDGRTGGGTRVLPRSPSNSSSPNPPAAQHRSAVANTRISVLGAKMIAAYSPASPLGQDQVHTPFTLGVPALDAFPVSIWARLNSQRWRKTPRLMLCPDDGPGYGPLREAIAEYIVTARAVRCSPEQVVITSGAQQAIDLLSRLLLNSGDTVWVEEFGYQPARAAFVGVGGHPIEIPIDENGLDVERGKQLAPDARLAYVTPACEPPFNVSMSPQRRAALLDWAQTSGAWILEDDYSGELHYQGQQSAALRGLDHPGARRVIYLRTFSKTLFPALRLGYVVLPLDLVDAFTRARLVADRHSPIAEQAVLTDFITGGHFARHVRSMRELYAERQGTFLEMAELELGELLRFRPASAGIRLVGRLPFGICDQQVALNAARQNVVVQPVSGGHHGQSDFRGLALGYMPFRQAQLRPAMKRLADVIRCVQG
jgi:GntR family transcriptional regulator/MocR family aminotransferase